MLFKKVFEKIYDSEINCRLEWFWDTGFTWSIQDGTIFPRILKDGDLGEISKKTVRSEFYSKEIKNPTYEKDWIVRGESETIDGAFYDMISAIEKHFPNSKFTKWVKDYNENMEHFYICIGCGDLVDKRNLGEVFDHEHGKDSPIIDKTKKYIVKKDGDNKAWIDGNSIDLN
jgi:hypothetical protein